MTGRKRTATGKRGGGKLKLKRQTLRDLDAGERGRKAKGGAPTPPGPIPIPYPNTGGCSESPTCACPTAACVTMVSCLACVRR